MWFNSGANTYDAGCSKRKEKYRFTDKENSDNNLQSVMDEECVDIMLKGIGNSITECTPVEAESAIRRRVVTKCLT